MRLGLRFPGSIRILPLRHSRARFRARVRKAGAKRIQKSQPRPEQRWHPNGLPGQGRGASAFCLRTAEWARAREECRRGSGKEAITSDTIDEFIRLPRADRVRNIKAPLKLDGRCLAKRAYRVAMSDAVVPRPVTGAYKTCKPEAHSKQVVGCC